MRTALYNVLWSTCFILFVMGNTDEDQIAVMLDEERVVGGSNAQVGEAPYQISMQTKFGHHCGGSIIGERWILTAAHCVYGKKPSDFKILAGTIDITEGGTTYYPDLLLNHSRYNEPRFSNDVGLIRLNDTITFTESIQPIEYSERELRNNVTLKLTGWGRTSSGGAIPNVLQKLELAYINNTACRKYYQKSESPLIDVGHICTLNQSGEGSCNGDSGGPLVYDNKLVALVNWGVVCAKGYPDAHARISYYHDWIRTNVNNFS